MAEKGNLRVLRIAVVDWILDEKNDNLRQVARALGAKCEQIDIIVYSPRRHGYSVVSLAPNTTVYPTNSVSKIHFFPDALRIARTHIKNHYDLVVTADPMGAGLIGYQLKRQYNIPWLIMLRNDYYSSLAWVVESPRYLFDYVLSIWLLRKGDWIHAVTGQLVSDIIRLGISPDRISSFPSVMRTHMFSPGENNLDRYNAGNLLFAGRLSPEKGITTLLQAVRILVQRGYTTHLKLVGTGPWRRKLERLAHRLNLKPTIEFLGHVSQNELASLYQQSSILVLPSNREAFGRVIVEAGMCGLPAVATNVGGVSGTLIDGLTGILVPPRDAKTMANAIAKLFDEPQTTREMGNNALREYREKYNFEKLVDQHVDLMKLVAGNAPSISNDFIAIPND